MTDVNSDIKTWKRQKEGPHGFITEEGCNCYDRRSYYYYLKRVDPSLTHKQILDIVNKAYPLQPRSPQEQEVMKGVLTAKPGVDLAAKGLTLFFTTVAPGTFLAEFEALNVLTIENKFLLGRVTAPPATLGPAPFGNKMHKEIVDWLQQEYPNTNFQFKIKPGETGIDVEVISGGKGGPPWKYAEIKPNTISGRKTVVNQLDNWEADGEIIRDQTIILTYSKEGEIYWGFVNPK
jgi:hypothetical protein